MRVRRLLVGVAVLTCGTAIALAAVETVKSSKPPAALGQQSPSNPLGINYDYSKPESIAPYEKDGVTKAVATAMGFKNIEKQRLERVKTALEKLLKQPAQAVDGVHVQPVQCGGQYCAAIVVYDDVRSFVRFDSGKFGDPHSPLAHYPGGAGRTSLLKRGGKQLVATWYTFEGTAGKGG
jgi:hypothetical protein